MNRILRYLVICAFVWAASVRLYAQETFTDKLQGSAGFSLEFIPIDQNVGFGSSPLFPNATLVYGLNGGASYVLTHFEDIYALHIAVNPTLSFNYNNIYGTTFFGQLPIYLVAKVGANATKYNEQVVGLSLGLGVTVSYLTLPFSNQYAPNGLDRISQAFISPAAMAEFTFRINGRVYGIRGHANLLPYKASNNLWDNTGIQSPIPLKFGNYGFGLVSYF